MFLKWYLMGQFVSDDHMDRYFVSDGRTLGIQQQRSFSVHSRYAEG